MTLAITDISGFSIVVYRNSSTFSIDFEWECPKLNTFQDRYKETSEFPPCCSIRCNYGFPITEPKCSCVHAELGLRECVNEVCTVYSFHFFRPLWITAPCSAHQGIFIFELSFHDYTVHPFLIDVSWAVLEVRCGITFRFGLLCGCRQSIRASVSMEVHGQAYFEVIVGIVCIVDTISLNLS